MYDVLILGSGPAGLAAALALGRARRSAIILSHETFRNGRAAATHILGADGVNPNEYRETSRKQVLDKYETITYKNVQIVKAQSSKDDATRNPNGLPTLYTLTSVDGEEFTGRKVVWAPGSVDVFPEIEGYNENWPCNIYQGLFCDGWERNGHEAGIGVLAFPTHPIHAHNALRAFDFSPPRVIIFTNGPVAKDDPMQQVVQLAMANGVTLDERKIARLEGLSSGRGITVHFEEGKSETLGFIIHRAWTEPGAWELSKQLGLETDSMDYFGTFLKREEPLGTTSAPGVFACGDVASIGKGTPISHAHGVVAVDAIWAELATEDGMARMHKRMNGKA